MGLFASRTRRRGLVEGICDALDWTVDERHGQAIGLHFPGDDVTPQRTVYISEGETAVTFAVPTRTEIPQHEMPDELPAALLLRNDELGLGAWAAKVVRGEVTFILQYSALAAGVDANSFKTILSIMLREVATVEATLERQGLL